MESITKTVVLSPTEKVEFSRLSLQQLFSLADEVQAEKEQSARSLGKQENCTKYEIMNLILQVRATKATIQEILASASSPQGAARILVKSLNVSKVDPNTHASIIEKLSIPDAIEIARMLVLDVQDEPEVKVEEAVSPLASSPSSGLPSVPTPAPAKTESLGYYGQTANEVQSQ